MKTILSFITVFSIAVHAQTPSNISEYKTFKIEQETTAFQLQHQEKEPVYETQEQPSTCYRTVQRGTREECHTEYDRECNTTMENECRSVPYPVCESVQKPVCQSVPRRVCHSEPRQKCETNYEQQCHNESRNVCENVPRRECHAETRQNCTTTNQQVCENQSVPVCQNEPQQVCETVQKCETVSDQVCRGEGAARVCQTVPRRVCTPQQQCRTVNHQVCHNETKNVCHNVPRQTCSPVTEQVCNTVNSQVCHTQNVPVCQQVPRQSCHMENEQVCSTQYDQVCHTETQQQCHNEYRQECRSVPRESCRNVPRQACEQVPNMEQEAYACTKPVQVQVGERLKSSVLANVKVQLADFAKLPPNQDEIIARLIKTQEGDDVSLKLGKNEQKLIYRIVKKERAVQVISATEKVVNVTFVIERVSIDQLAAMKDLKIVEPRIFSEKITFKLQNAAGNFPVNQTVLFEQGSLNVIEEYRRKIYVIIDQTFDPSLKIKKTAESYEIAVSGFGVRYLEDANHQVKLELKLKSLFDPKELLNPEILDQVKLGTLHNEFQGFPE